MVPSFRAPALCPPTAPLATGQRREQSIALYDYRARFYDPLTANFLSPDTVVPGVDNPLDWNRFAYVRNNPVKYTDPSGHCAEFGDDACWGLYERIIRECPECSTIVTGNGIVPLHEASYDRLMVYRRDRIVNPVDYPDGLWGLILPEDGTLTISIGAAANLLFWNGSADFGFYSTDEKGNVALGTFSWSVVGATNELGISVGPSIAANTAPDLSQLPGLTHNFGAGAAGGGIAGTAYNTFTQGRDGLITGSKLAVGVGPQIALPVPLAPLVLHVQEEFTNSGAIYTRRINADGSISTCTSFLFRCSLSTFDETLMPSQINKEGL